jgi:hypothetical protein
MRFVIVARGERRTREEWQPEAYTCPVSAPVFFGGAVSHVAGVRFRTLWAGSTDRGARQKSINARQLPAISQKARKTLDLCKTSAHPQNGTPDFAATNRRVTVLVVDASAAEW